MQYCKWPRGVKDNLTGDKKWPFLIIESTELSKRLVPRDSILAPQPNGTWQFYGFRILCPRIPSPALEDPYVVQTNLRICAALKKTIFLSCRGQKKVLKIFYKKGLMQLFSADAIVFSKKSLKKNLTRKHEKNALKSCS